MIGRFSSLGAYKGLFAFKELALCLAGGVLALAAYLIRPETGPVWPSVLLGLLSVAINGLPIVIGAVRGVMERRVNVDELVSLAPDAHAINLTHYIYECIRLHLPIRHVHPEGQCDPEVTRALDQVLVPHEPDPRWAK